MLNKKFELMENLHRYEGHLVRAERTANQLKVVKNLTKRLMEHHYLDNALTEYHKKYGYDAIEFESEPSEYGMVDGKPKFFTLVDKRSEKQKKEFSVACEHADKMEAQDLEMLLKLMKRNINSWWD